MRVSRREQPTQRPSPRSLAEATSGDGDIGATVARPEGSFARARVRVAPEGPEGCDGRLSVHGMDGWTCQLVAEDAASVAGKGFGKRFSGERDFLG